MEIEKYNYGVCDYHISIEPKKYVIVEIVESGKVTNMKKFSLGETVTHDLAMLRNLSLLSDPKANLGKITSITKNNIIIVASIKGKKIKRYLNPLNFAKRNLRHPRYSGSAKAA